MSNITLEENGTRSLARLGYAHLAWALLAVAGAGHLYGCNGDDCEAGGECNTGQPCEMGRIVCTDDGEQACVFDRPRAAGVECRASAGPCDPAERCDGSSRECPADARAVGTECRASQGDCDPVEVCNGTDAACPADVLADDQTVCRPGGECDVAELCTGASPVCPDDVFEPMGVRCSVGYCDGSGQCMQGCLPGDPCDTGEACEVGEIDCSTGTPRCVPTDLVAAGTECRPTAGPCDVAENCDGVNSTCPANVFDVGTECRASSGICDVAEACNGQGPLCPMDVFAPGNQACDDGNLCTYDDRCNGLGACIGTALVCDDDPGICGARRSCDGTSACAVTYPAATSCNDGNLCTYDDACNGAGSCQGTPIVCASDACNNRSCNGSSTCDVSFTTSACNDGNACTYSDQCALGTCSGIAYVCNDDPAVCGANRSCNGAGGCTVGYPGATTSCGRCGSCDGGGGCNDCPFDVECCPAWPNCGIPMCP